MTYTPTDQLPPPPKFMLDEVEVAEKAHLEDLMNRCFTIRTFRKHVLPIYYANKSATGKIMGDAIEVWKQKQREQAEYRRLYGPAGYREIPVYEDPRYLTRTDFSFHRRFMNSNYYNYKGEWRCDSSDASYYFKSPCAKKVLAKKKLVEKMGRQFVAYKTGKVPETRMRVFRELEGNYNINTNGNFWEYMAKFKANKFKDRYLWN